MTQPNSTPPLNKVLQGITRGESPTPADRLHAELRTLIASSRQRVAGAVNAQLTRLYWSVGQRLRTELLGGADRAKYGDQHIKRMGDQLAQEFGRVIEAKNLGRMVQFAQVLAEPEIVATLSRQLSGSHFVNLLPFKTERTRQFYANQAASQTWSVRELRQQVERKAFERTELASLQTPTPVRAAPTGAIDLILRAESSREQVELLQVHKDSITVAEYRTELPPKAELKQCLHQALIEARERLARQGGVGGG